eukprot:s938_g12.t1
MPNKDAVAGSRQELVKVAVLPFHTDRLHSLPLLGHRLAQEFCQRPELVLQGTAPPGAKDVMGMVSLVTAEAELLSAVVSFFESVGITSKDIGLKINSRKAPLDLGLRILHISR